LGQIRSEVTRTLIRKIKSGLTRSTETKLKISETLRGRTHNDETKAKMSLLKISDKILILVRFIQLNLEQK
jgi:hypothetical protein